jgi:hypothetical protein
VGGPLKKSLFNLGRIIGALIFIMVLSLSGIVSGKPIMILAYAGFFLLVMFAIFLFVRKNQRHFEIISQRNKLMSKIIGTLMVLIAIAIPALAITNMQLFELGSATIGLKVILAVVALTITLLISGVVGVYLINRSGSKLWHKILGYLIIIGASSVPALMVIPYDRTTTGIGSVYFVVIMVAILSWWGLSLYLYKD